MFCKNSYELPAEFLSLGRTRAKASLLQANISQGGGGPPQATVLTPAPPHCAWWSRSNTVRAAEHLRNQEANRSLSAGDLRDICLDETRCSTLPQHKTLAPLLPSSKRHDPAYLPGQQGRSREHSQAIKHDMKLFWAKWNLYPRTDVPLWRSDSSCLLAAPSNLTSRQNPCSSLTAPERFHQLLTLANTERLIAEVGQVQ